MIIAVGVAVGMVETTKDSVVMELNRLDIMLIIELVHQLRVCVVIAKRTIAITSLILLAIGMPSIGMRIRMIESMKHGVIMVINWRYIVRIVKLVLELWVCVVEVIAISAGAVAALRCVESILLCKVVLGHIFMLVNHWCVAEIVLSVVSVRLLLRLVVFLGNILWVMSCLMDRFLMVDGLLFRSDWEVCSDGRFEHWLFMDWLEMVHFRLFLFSGFAASLNWLTLLTPQVKLGLTHGHFFSFGLLLFESDVVLTPDVVMDCHSGDFLHVFVSCVVTDGGGLDVGNSLMDNWGCDNRLRMVISYSSIVAFIITRVEVLIDRGINPAIAPTILLNSVIQVSITLEVTCLDLFVGLLDLMSFSLMPQNTSTLHTKHFLLLLVKLPSVLFVV